MSRSNKSVKNALVVLFGILSCQIGICSDSGKVYCVEQAVRIGSTRFQAEIADTEEKITQGLSDRRDMPYNHGMLFVFPDSSHRVFWMYHCHFDLDIAYIAPTGVIEDIQTMYTEPLDLIPEKRKLYRSKTSNIMYVLEMNRSWFSQHGITIGDTVSGIVNIPSYVKDADHWSK